MTFNGLTFANTSGDSTYAMLSAGEGAASGAQEARVTLSGHTNAVGPYGAGLIVDMNSYSSGGAEQLANRRNFNFSTSTAAPITIKGDTIAYGTITSIEQASVPEPSTLIILAALGIAALVPRSHLRRNQAA